MKGRAGIDSRTVAVPADVDGLEVHGVAIDGELGEVVALGEPSQFYMVAWHMKAGGMDTLEDFDTVEDARTFAAELNARAQLPHGVHDYA